MPLPERKLIEHIQRLSGRVRNSAVLRPIGDDCAVLGLTPGSQLLVTTDFSIENVHFRRGWHPPQSVGHRCLARGLSDIAAMGGQPLACFLSFGLPANTPQRWVDSFFQGLLALARSAHVQLAGGDLSSAPAITADIVVVGQAPSGKAVLRSGARPGDRIYVTGDLGGSTAVLEKLFQGKRVPPRKSDRHFYPQPRLKIGAWLRQHNLATAMIDLSDGLSVDLAHICEESRVSARIKAGLLPLAKSANLRLALHGGEDYELLFTASPGTKVPTRIAGVRVTEIGLIERKSRSSDQVLMQDEKGRLKPLPALAWQHFRK